MSVINLSVFGDNILECERMNELIQKAFPELVSSQYDIEHIYAPIKILSNNEDFLNIQLFPDYKSDDRWGDKSILTLLSENGATLSEAPDAVLTRSINNVETILLAIEFSSAIPAGNQAWQRSGRALSFSEVNIPYLYITDIDTQQMPLINNYKNRTDDDPVRAFNVLKINGIPNLFGPHHVETFYSQEMHLTINDSFIDTSGNIYKTTGFGLWQNENSETEYINNGTLNIIGMVQINQIEQIPYTVRAVYMWPDWISTGRNLSQPDLNMENFYKFSSGSGSIHKWNVTIKHTGCNLDGIAESHNIDIDASSNGEL